MNKLETTYMGIKLDNPVIIGASNMSNDPDMLKKSEEYGAGAIVFKSLFEEQIQLESFQLDEKLAEFNDIYAEMLTIHPDIKHAGPDEHLLNIRNAKESLSVPLIVSLNAVNNDTWLKYAGLLGETGADGLELNFYQIPSDFEKNGESVENEQIKILKEIRKNTSIPISVKLSPDYSNILNFIKKLDKAGADAFVLFNAFFQPDIDVNDEKHIKTSHLSHEGDYKKSLRYTGLLFDNIQADICGSHGIFSGEDVIKLVLSGATTVQIVSTLYRNGLTQISDILREMENWMDSKGYKNLSDFRGKLSRNRLTGNPFVYKRAQYVDLLLNSEEIFKGS
jgi:dihydroorotate dehydrogenase (fumarate)